jgi:Tfp pilus assembly major pilin PilA
MSLTQLNDGLNYLLFAVAGSALLWLVVSFGMYVRVHSQPLKNHLSASTGESLSGAIALLQSQNHELKQQVLQLTQQITALQKQVETNHAFEKPKAHRALGMTQMKSKVQLEDGFRQQVIDLYQNEALSNRAIAKQLKVDRNKVNAIVREHKRSQMSAPNPNPM